MSGTRPGIRVRVGKCPRFGWWCDVERPLRHALRTGWYLSDGAGIGERAHDGWALTRRGIYRRANRMAKRKQRYIRPGSEPVETAWEIPL